MPNGVTEAEAMAAMNGMETPASEPVEAPSEASEGQQISLGSYVQVLLSKIKERDARIEQLDSTNGLLIARNLDLENENKALREMSAAQPSRPVRRAEARAGAKRSR